MIKLYRAQITGYKGIGGLDITVKSAKGFARFFAPTWDMVMGHKQGRLTDNQYTFRYTQILARMENGKEVIPIKDLCQFGWDHSDAITFLCYCRDGAFCHTYILMDYLIHNWPHLFEKGE